MGSDGLRWARGWLGEAIRFASDKWHDLASVGSGDRTARRFGAFGEGTVVAHPFGAVYGQRYIHLGADTLIAPHVSMSAGMVPGQPMVTDPVVRIGNGCLIGRGTSIVGHFCIDIGDDVFTGMNVYITDQNHAYEDVDSPIGRQMPVDSPVRIGAGSWIGSGAVILPGADIGEHVVVGANSVVRGTVPSRTVVAGVPAALVRDHDGVRWKRAER